MILRSSSTPILTSVNYHHVSHPEIFKEVDYEGEAPVSPIVGYRNQAGLSPAPAPAPAFRKNSIPHGSHHAFVVDSIAAPGEGSREFERELVSRPRIRKAQSESDLVNLGNGVACKYAANSLLGFSSEGRENIREHSRSFHKHWSRRLSLTQGNGNAEAHSRSWRIVEDTDLSDSESEDERIGNANVVSNGKVRTPVIQSDQKSSSVESTDRIRRFEELDEDYERKVLPSSLRRQTEQSVSGRSAEGFVMSDGVVYTSIQVGCNGRPVVCNSKGCRPLYESEKLGPMFIAGGLGLGMGGGHHGGSSKRGYGGDFGADSSSTESYYVKQLQADPQNPLLLRNYAKFLLEVRHDNKRAEEYYHRAILAGPGDGDVLSEYAKLVWDVNRDEDRAESYYEQAVQAAPDDCYVLGSYASFLWESEDNEQIEDSSYEQPLPSVHGASLVLPPMVASTLVK